MPLPSKDPSASTTWSAPTTPATRTSGAPRSDGPSSAPARGDRAAASAGWPTIETDSIVLYKETAALPDPLAGPRRGHRGGLGSDGGAEGAGPGPAHRPTTTR